ncbi:MAG: hypothetical protein J1F37_03245 [Oscillospiraceae bacterium]|nr:hypothetical protein [Oscillospiraceae bacterium]
MLKRILIFYLGSIILSIAYFFTVGGVIGWFATEGESVIATFIVCLATFIGLMFISHSFINKAFSNYALKRKDIYTFLAPYFVLLAIMCILYIVNIFREDNLISNQMLLELMETDMFDPFIAFLLPSAYVIILMYDIFYYSYTAFYLTAIICSIIHITIIAILLKRKMSTNE